MKITLDLTDLVARGALSPAEAERLKGLAARETGSVGINILLAFGIVTVVGGVGVLLPTPLTAVILGGGLFALGAALLLTRSEAWTLLAQICLTIGALTASAGLMALVDGSQAFLAVLAMALGAAAVLARSGLLAAIAVIVLSSALGSTGGYANAMYRIIVPEPALSVGALSLLTLLLYLVSLRVPPAYERLAIIAARTAIIMINVALLVGSIWGDSRTGLSSIVIGIAWAVLLVGIGVWGVSVNRRWVVNMAAVFGAIHFYTQWFTLLGANPIAVLGAGLLLVAFGMALYSFNRRRQAGAPPPPAMPAPPPAAA